MQAELGGGCRLAGALEPDEHDDGRWRFRLLQGRVPAAEHFDHLLVDDIDDLVHRREALRDVGAKGTFANARHEILDDLVVDVCLEQGEAHFAKGLVEVFFGYCPAPAEAPENALQLIGQRVEHIYKMRFYGQTYRPSRKSVMAPGEASAPITAPCWP